LGPWGSETITQGPFRVLTHNGQVRIEQGNLRIRNRPYFENYIVDASIFRPGFIPGQRFIANLFVIDHLCVSSFKEHTVDALAIGADEGRSNLR
jgi:hypothetical protein